MGNLHPVNCGTRQYTWRILTVTTVVKIVLGNWSSELNCQNYAYKTILGLGLNWPQKYPLGGDVAPYLVDIYIKGRQTAAVTTDKFQWWFSTLYWLSDIHSCYSSAILLVWFFFKFFVETICSNKTTFPICSIVHSCIFELTILLFSLNVMRLSYSY